jgi:peptidoglycan/xylan/chitin deacetylase (PgdA/CDA1 family)
MYICPGLIGEETPFWWDVVRTAPPATLRSLLPRQTETVDDTIHMLKTLPDEERRQIIDKLHPPHTAHGRQLSTAQLDRWLTAGHDVGNHTWDHPVLDRCADDEQRRQVRLADDWLRTHVAGWTPLFAYPNGNWAAGAHHELVTLGYASAVMHDHRLADPKGDALQISRLHVNADDAIDRFASVVSGVQPLLRSAGAAVRAPLSARRRRPRS